MYYFLYDNINDAYSAAKEVKGKVFKASIVGYKDGFVAVTKSNKKPIAWTRIHKIFEPRIREAWKDVRGQVITRLKSYKYGFKEQTTPEFMYIGD